MKYQNWLSWIYEISNIKKNKLFQMGISAEELYYTSKDILSKIDFLTEKDVERIILSKSEYDIDRIWEDLNYKGINLVTIEQNTFPGKLRNIENCPYGLYYIGKLPDENEKIIAMVGARNRSAYGQEIANKIAYELGRNGFSVISGLARGIDSDSHKGVMDAKAKTYAVLGSGVDVCYPAQNKFLYDRVLENGAIISENRPGTRPQSIFFPLRNRIISGLCDALILVEAKTKSGSLISADYAMEQGKDVYVVPGRITDELSSGCNRLIGQGAHIISSIEDLFEQLDVSTYNNCVQLDFRKNLLEKDEALVYSLLDFRPIGISNIMDEINVELSKLLVILENLQNKGFVREIVPNYFVKVL